MVKIFNYLSLYRLDVAVLSIIIFVVGVFMAGGVITKDNLLISILVSFISMNFIYSFNSYSDREIDAINKPSRPIPSGKISAKEALVYSIFLFLESIIYPLFYIKSVLTAILFYFMPIAGLLYSWKPLGLRRSLLPSVIIMTLGLHCPLLLGYFLTTESLDKLPFFISTFLFCLAVIPLKDIRDIKGDIKYNYQNWLAKLEKRGLFLMSFLILLLNIILVFIFKLPLLYKISLIIFNLTPIFLISLAIPKGRLIYVYERIVVAVIIEGVIFIVLYKFLFNTLGFLLKK